LEEIMARGCIDEPQLARSALLIRLSTIVFSSAIAAAIALALGYKSQIVALTLLAIWPRFRRRYYSFR
jgi:hypothetical protein